MHLRLPAAFRPRTTTPTITPAVASSVLSSRSLSTTAALAAQPTQITIQSKTYDILEPPPYPYGPAQWFKQSNRGLYGGASIRYGNNVSHKTETKTRRTWHPNVVHKNIFSAALNRKIRLRVTTRVLRTIDKVGGLDEYLLGDKESRIRELGVEGWKLRWAVMNSDWGRARMGEQAKELGLPEEVRAQRGWMKKSEFEKFMLSCLPAEDLAKSPEEQEQERRFQEKEMTNAERKDFRKIRAKEEKAQRAALWDAPEIQRMWEEIRGTRVIVAKSKTLKGKEIQRVMVLKEATKLEDLVPEEVEEWSEEDDARVAYDADALASLGEEAHEEVAPGAKEPTKVAQ